MTTERALLNLARDMRRNPTEPEKRLWRHLSNSQLDGLKFRRQAEIGQRIFDFFCPSIGLIVEIDGDTHDRGADELTDAQLSFPVVRVTKHEVMTNMAGVLQAIASHAVSLPPRWPHPNPAAGKRCPASFRSCRGHGRPDAPEGEGLEPSQ